MSGGISCILHMGTLLPVQSCFLALSDCLHLFKAGLGVGLFMQVPALHLLCHNSSAIVAQQQILWIRIRPHMCGTTTAAGPEGHKSDRVEFWSSHSTLTPSALPLLYRRFRANAEGPPPATHGSGRCAVTRSLVQRYHPGETKSMSGSRWSTSLPLRLQSQC